MRVPDDVLDTLAARGTPIGAGLGCRPPRPSQGSAGLRAMMERAGLTPELFRQLRLDFVRAHASRRGARFVAGRDAGISPFLAHGSLHEGLGFLTEAGATAEEALAAATSLAAEACGAGDRKGRLRPASTPISSLCRPPGDLAHDVSRLTDVRAVVLAGSPL